MLGALRQENSRGSGFQAVDALPMKHNVLRIAGAAVEPCVVAIEPEEERAASVSLSKDAVRLPYRPRMRDIRVCVLSDQAASGAGRQASPGGGIK